jgi:hypothetical protein
MKTQQSNKVKSRNSKRQTYQRHQKKKIEQLIELSNTSQDDNHFLKCKQVKFDSV